MALSSLLKAFCFLIGYLTVGIAGLSLPLDQGIDSPDSLSTISLNVSKPGPPEERCTSSLLWIGTTIFDSHLTTDCFLAWKSFLSTDFETYKNIEFEFVQQGVTPSHPGSPTMATPRRYVHGETIVHFGDQNSVADHALSRLMYNCNCQSCGHSKRNIAGHASWAVPAGGSRAFREFS